MQHLDWEKKCLPTLLMDSFGVMANFDSNPAVPDDLV